MVINSVINFFENSIFLDVIILTFFALTLLNSILFLINLKKEKKAFLTLLLQTLAVNGLEIVLFALAERLTNYYLLILFNLAVNLLFIGYGYKANFIKKPSEKEQNKKFTITKSQKKFINILDKKIHSQNNEENSENKVISQPKILKTQEVEKPVQYNQPNYSHVKNVLERLNYYNLTPQEKRQIENLKEDLTLAETGNYNRQSNVNEGLGVLLKIMAKYKV